MTTRDERLLLTELKRLCEEAPGFALAFPESSLPLWDEFNFGFRLLDVGYGILMHARERQRDLAGFSDATAELKRHLKQQQGLVLEPLDHDAPPSAEQTVLGDPDCPEG